MPDIVSTLDHRILLILAESHQVYAQDKGVQTKNAQHQRRRMVVRLLSSAHMFGWMAELSNAQHMGVCTVHVCVRAVCRDSGY